MCTCFKLDIVNLLLKTKWGEAEGIMLLFGLFYLLVGEW